MSNKILFLSALLTFTLALTSQRALFLEQSERSYAENEYEDGANWEWAWNLYAQQRDLQVGTLSTSETSYGENEYDDGYAWEWARNLPAQTLDMSELSYGEPEYDDGSNWLYSRNLASDAKFYAGNRLAQVIPSRLN